GHALQPRHGAARRPRRPRAGQDDRRGGRDGGHRRHRPDDPAPGGGALGRARLRICVLAGGARRAGGGGGPMRRLAIAGAGMTSFAEHFGLGIKDLLPMAVGECERSVDKGLDRADIQAAWFGELTTTDGFPAGVLADSCGLVDVPVTRVENACATGNDALRNAVFGVASGYVDVALVVGGDKVRESSARSTFWEWAAMTRDMAWDYPLGLVAPANFALHVARYLHESPATREHMAMVAVKNHRHALNNPKAQLRFEITVEQVLNAPMVVDPFGLYDCTPQSDGAAAL